MNKIRNINSLWAVLMFAGLFMMAACSKNDDVSPDKRGDNFTVKEKELTFLSEPTYDTIHISSDMAWTATASNAWVKLGAETGEGDTDLVVTVSENTKAKSRRANVILSAGMYTDTVQVIQYGVEAEFNFYSDNYLYEKDTLVLRCDQKRLICHIAGNVTYNPGIPREDDKWIILGETTVTQDPENELRRDFTILFQDNWSEEPRYTRLTIQARESDEQKVVVIKQEGYVFGLTIDKEQLLGSDFKCTEFMLTEYGDVAGWKYEFCDENGNPHTYPWLGALRKVKCTPTKNLVGQRYYLRGTCEYNPSAQERIAYLKLSYKGKGGAEVSKVVRIVQLARNPTKSDSLALINLLFKNAVPSYGLNVGWDIAKPVTDWYDKCIWGQDAEGYWRVNRLLISDIWLCYDLTAYLGNLSEMTQLSVSMNYLRGEIPAELGYCEKLERLDISDNYVGPGETAMGPSGEECGIEAVSPEVFARCTRLSLFNASGNSLKEIPAGLLQAVNMEEIELSNNAKIREFPTDWSTLTKLRILNMNNLRSYNGGFPQFIFTIPSLEKISLGYYNWAPGTTIPDEFDKLPELRYIAIDNGNISGKLPRTLGQCKKLITISFTVDNTLDKSLQGLLEGTLPEEYGYLDSLRSISLANNQLIGEIPASWANLLDYYKRTDGQRPFGIMSLNDNNLSGDIPEAMLNHPAWQGKDVDFTTSSGKTVFIPGYTMSINPGRWICPQRAGYGFNNCK